MILTFILCPFANLFKIPFSIDCTINLLYKYIIHKNNDYLSHVYSMTSLSLINQHTVTIIITYSLETAAISIHGFKMRSD